MQLVQLVSCSAGGCPMVFDTDGEDVVVQGLHVADAVAGGLVDGEARVLVPRTLLLQAADRLRAAGAPRAPALGNLE